MTDFQRLIQSPVEVYQEGLRFFMGEGILNETLRRVAQDLENHGINYALIGAVALNAYGYRRFTEDIDLLMTREGLEKFSRELVGAGYRPLFPGAKKRFRETADNVTIEIITTGEFPGDGLPKPVEFPPPEENVTEIDHVKTLNLEKIIELKLASGMTAPHRLKDLADVQELIKIKNLSSDFADQLNPFVRNKFLELQSAVAQSKEREFE